MECEQFPLFTEIIRQFEKDYELMKTPTKKDLFLEAKDRSNNEMISLKRKNTNLNDALSWTIKQRDVERTEIGTLSKQLESMQIEKENVTESLKGLYII